MKTACHRSIQRYVQHFQPVLPVLEVLSYAEVCQPRGLDPLARLWHLARRLQKSYEKELYGRLLQVGDLQAHPQSSGKQLRRGFLVLSPGERICWRPARWWPCCEMW